MHSQIYSLVQIKQAQTMSNYPLSARSSKKNKINQASAIKDTIFQQSICRSKKPSTFDPSQYTHILEGENIFIEIYYEGKVIQTQYNEWVRVLGGTNYKRLNPKVTIFLTTNQSKSVLKSIMERIKKICPNCIILSILWFQQCFRQKEKVPIEEFILNYDDIKEKEKKSQENKEKHKFQFSKGFLNNIKEDIRLDAKQFAKEYKKDPFIRYFKRNQKVQDFEPSLVIKLSEIDLGPLPMKAEKIPRKKSEKICNQKITKRDNRFTFSSKQIKQFEEKNQNQDENVTKSMQGKKLHKSRSKSEEKSESKLNSKKARQIRLSEKSMMNALIQKYQNMETSSKDYQKKQKKQRQKCNQHIFAQSFSERTASLHKDQSKNKQLRNSIQQIQAKQYYQNNMNKNNKNLKFNGQKQIKQNKSLTNKSIPLNKKCIKRQSKEKQTILVIKSNDTNEQKSSIKLKYALQKDKFFTKADEEQIKRIQKQFQNSEKSNSILVTGCPRVQKKIKEINALCKNNPNKLINVSYLPYQQVNKYVSHTNYIPGTIYYVATKTQQDNKLQKIKDLALFYILKSFAENKIKFLQQIFLDDIFQYNQNQRQLKAIENENKKANNSQFPMKKILSNFSKEEIVRIDLNFCYSKKIAVLQFQILNQRQYEQLIKYLKGQYFPPSKYLLMKTPCDIIVSNRKNSIKQKYSLTITEEEFIQKLFETHTSNL